MKNLLTCPNIQIDKIPMNRVNHFTFLGFIIDQKLTFNLHISFLCNKVSKSVGIINKISYLPPNVLKCLYYSMVNPYLIYCIESWGPSYATNLSPLIILQNRVIRIITNNGKLTHTAPLFTKLDILKLDELCNFFIGINFYKIIYQCKANYILNDLSLSQISRVMQLRNNDKFRLPVNRVLKLKQSLIYRGTKIWNALPNSIKNTPSVNVFKKNLKAWEKN